MFEANGTEGLELFTWIVAGLGGLVVALILTNFLIVKKEEDANEEIEARDTERHNETVV